MPIEFSPARWDRIKADYHAWWEGRLERPLIPVHMAGRDPGRPRPNLNPARQWVDTDFAIPPDAAVDLWDWQLSGVEYLGDAFPRVWPNLGPGVLAVFLGARPEPAPDTVWFHAPGEKECADLAFKPDLDHPWYRRIRDLMEAAGRRWQGLVQVGMTDLGGNLDILSTFRPGERFLLDLIDHPQEVKRLTWEAHEAWWRCFEALDAVLRPTNPGWSAWAGIYAPDTHYMLQCDFAYMIGPKMFEEFVLPELAATCRRLRYAFYHLDGVGQLHHLDLLLSIPELKGIQWIPGAGQKPCGEWPEVYEKIRRAGKLVQFLGSLDEFDRIVDRLGSAKGFVLWAIPVEPKDRDRTLRRLERYGAA